MRKLSPRKFRNMLLKVTKDSDTPIYSDFFNRLFEDYKNNKSCLNQPDGALIFCYI